jgi:RsiW-degrading membrane proteinase PrsW (M82 family)
LRHDHGRKLPVESLWVAFGFGILGLIAAGILESKLLPLEEVITGYDVSLMKGFVVFMAVGLIEETAKFLPLALYIYKKPYFKEHTDGVIYFAICGLTFGLLENILYTVSLGIKVGLMRLLITPFLHAATTAILGYYLASYKLKRTTQGKFVLACLAIPFIHGFYDFAVFSHVLQLAVIALMITLSLTLGMFLYFNHANELDRAVPAMAAAAPNFCTNCGRSNERQTPFCESCGQGL